MVDLGVKSKIKKYNTDMKPLSKRDTHAAIAAFSFCFGAVIFEKEGAVFPFPRFLYEGQRKLKFSLRIYPLPRLLSREYFRLLRLISALPMAIKLEGK